ncbi:hypothetical protein [Qipengyuania nanhaisediminis]|uniref:Uncharacterized protein n=1 Tax=Qipengyuania nanhaisediminis TaxID=604088 RepID=A0A1I5NYV3_9SPHN|nr:hypothetical protein [Qipengyuania nanhaisediminis]SFP26982.1 hypothetical protein SAMN04488060_2195 [Qipengyuania nanhaisediminis]
MIPGLALLAASCALCGAGLLYLASPNQQWRKSHLVGRWPIPAGIALIVTSLLLLWQFAGWASTVFIAMTLLMLAWSIPPLAIAWVQNRRDNVE